MADNKQFNPLPLLSVKNGLDSSLLQIGSELELYFAAGWTGKEHLQLAHDELHRAVGVLQMLSLEGLAVFCKELETVLQEMLAQQQAPTNMHRDTLRGALLALTQYLDALADGASNTALRLFYSYQELHQLRGLESAFEVDLFFPEFGVELPSEVLNVPLVPAALSSVKKARAQYQRALLKWLRQDNPEQSLKTMRATVQAVMACAPQDQHRAFWWIATGLLDCLIHDGLPAELSANKLLARIDLQMKSMVENTQRDSEYNTTCNMQYMLARSHPVSETVDKIKQTYELGAYLPETLPLSHGEASKILALMREQLNEAQEMLELCAVGDVESNKRFAEKLEQLHTLSEELDRDTLQFLCKQMHIAVSNSDDADAVHKIKMEMAMAMMLLSNGIDNYLRIGSLFHDQVRLVNQFLQTGLPVEGEDSKDAMLALISLHCQMAEQEVLLPLATEMKSNLQQVELSLNVFFSDAGKRGELAPLRRLLVQVKGGLYLLSLDVACKLILPVQQAIERYINGSNPSASEMHAIASAVSSLENYSHGLSQGQKPDTKILQDVLQSIQNSALQVEEKSMSHDAAIPSGVSVREGGEDAELLEVFLEEAHDVLETLHENLQICQRNPHSRDALIIIRRGYHTLKGSGRMVGLTNLGEVAWSIEKALNKWLQDEKSMSLSVLELIGDAEVLFQHWVERLRSGDSALIDTTDLVAAALRLENGEEEIRVAEKAAASVVEPEIPDIVIGGISLSPVLFSIATDEAASIIDTLQHQVVAMRKAEIPVVSYEFVRAAHTLAGINRSTGFTDIADLAGSLESWLQELMDTATKLDILQVNLLEQSINALAEMVNTLRNKQEPKARPDLLTRLQIKKKQLNKSESAEAHAVAQKPAQAKPEQSHVQHMEMDMDMEMGEANAAARDIFPDNEDEHLSLLSNQLQASNAADSKQIDEDMDLVAYVQRVAQEHANEPLQWQSPETLSDAGEQEQDLKNTQIHDQATAQDSSPFFLDMSELQADIADKPVQKNPEISATEEPFNFDFDDLALTNTLQAEATPQPQNYELQADFLSSIQDVELAGKNADVIPLRREAETQAQRKAQAVAADDSEHKDSAHDGKKRAIQDDLDEQLLPIFLEDADELYPQLTGELSNWKANPQGQDEGLKIARKLQRSLHTLKGSARMAGAMRLGELTHRVEDCLDTAVAAGKQDAALLEELENYFDRIGNALEKLRSGDTAEEAPAEQIAKVVDSKTRVVPAQSGTAVENIEERRESAVLRVRSDIVDDLVNEAGEISVARSRMEIELSAFKGGLLDLNGSVQGLRKLVREIEIHAEGQMQARAAVAGDSAEKFDPLEFDRFTRFQELTRFMNESVHDVQTVQQTLLKNLDETSAAMSAQSKLNTTLQQSLMSIRMLPFSSTSQRLYRIVRQTAKELGKKVNLELYGTEIELDRGVLEKMTAPFEHLLRNAIVHGLESPEQRELKGKQPIGNISLTLRQEGNEIVFDFKDDGAGLDTAKIRKKAIEQGMLQANEMISDENVMLLIFETGLSTAAELTEISGRGVGMDVVLSEIKALGGRIEVASEPDKGASFTIYLPLTLAVMKALMVKAGNETYAIPSVMVEQVQQVKPEALIELYKSGQAQWQGKTYPLYYLPRLLGDSERTPESKPYNPILLLHSGEQRMALHLDELSGNKEVVVKNVGEQLARLSGIAGATVQANGNVVLILNPVPLAQQGMQAKKVSAKAITETVRRIPVVMIVDDSLTVRKITTRLLTRVGYEVVTAKDGVDALEQLVDIIPDVMLLDVEMPRMDGFELTKQLRRDNKTRNLPIIMITSRTAEKHKNYAFELGVNGYLGKPYDDEELLANIALYAPLAEAATTS
jgi:chemosensory pili system protein ChpA (sensor histidine kinase/response regulator)